MKQLQEMQSRHNREKNQLNEDMNQEIKKLN